MTTGALYVARFSGPEHLVAATATLRQCSEVRSWSAVSGHVHLVVSLATPSAKIPTALVRLQGISEYRAYDIDDGGRTAVLDPSACHAYAFLEVEPGRTPDIARALASDPQVAWYAEARGGHELTVLMKADNFEALDRHLENSIRVLDGVIRLKADRVIDLRQL